MSKALIYFSFLLILFSSCEEYYTPKIDIIKGQLVVEAILTNDPLRNFVRLTRTRSFYDKLPPEAVSGARVDLVDTNGNVINGSESGTGYFIFNTIPVIGHTYMLRILADNETYESESVTMPPIPSITDFYTGHIEKKEYRTDGYGVPVAYNVIGRELYVDASVGDALSNYRFITRAVLEWSYNPPSMGGPPPPPSYGWFSRYENDLFNIAGPKKFSQIENIKKNPLMILPYNAEELLKPDSVAVGWIVIIDQFGTSPGSFEYHDQLNRQFAADGSLFDPIQTQIYGNITCKTDPSKTAFGYFDLNSYRQYRYFLRMTSPNSNIVLRQIFTNPDIPGEGETVGRPPDWWE